VIACLSNKLEIPKFKPPYCKKKKKVNGVQLSTLTLVSQLTTGKGAIYHNSIAYNWTLSMRAQIGLWLI
jgi:hypothetical protein